MNAILNPSRYNSLIANELGAVNCVLDASSTSSGTQRTSPARPPVQSAHLALIAIPDAFCRVSRRISDASACTRANVLPSIAGDDSRPTTVPTSYEYTWGGLWDWLLAEMDVVALGLYAARRAGSAASETTLTTGPRECGQADGPASGKETRSQSASTSSVDAPAFATLKANSREARSGRRHSSVLGTYPGLYHTLNRLKNRRGSTPTRRKPDWDSRPVEKQHTYVVPNPLRSQPLRDDDSIYVLIPPHVLPDARLTRLHTVHDAVIAAPAGRVQGTPGDAAQARKRPAPITVEAAAAPTPAVALTTPEPSEQGMKAEIARLREELLEERSCTVHLRALLDGTGE